MLGGKGGTEAYDPVCRSAKGGGVKMPRLPRLRGSELINALHKAGFTTVRTKGSHHFLRHHDGRCTVIPVHSGEVIGPGLLSKILKDIEFDLRDLTALLK